MNLSDTISMVRDSVVAVLKVHLITTTQDQASGQTNIQIQAAIVGTAWCVMKDKYFISAYHVLNNGKPRDPVDKYYIFCVPKNGPVAYHIPITNFVLEDATNDMMIFEIGIPSTLNITIPACFVTLKHQRDGTHVLTYGFPAPQIVNAQVDPKGNWIRGNLFLKAHANEGIVSGCYEAGGIIYYELNVGWHHGESGGPIITVISNVPAVFSIMQEYRNIQTQHGIMAGPHRGRSLKAIEKSLLQVGATII